MLAFSRGGSFSRQAIHVDDAIVTALAGLRPRLRTLGARLDIDVEAARRGRIAGNLDALAGAFSNLIDNALNHGAQGVTIRITAVADDAEFLTLRVEDDGPGIDPAALPRVFDPFFTTRERGTGLGLAVVQAVVLEHGGSLRAAASTLGGARFDIQLPWIVAAQIPQSPRKQV